jgi:hypothetical protein
MKLKRKQKEGRMKQDLIFNVPLNILNVYVEHLDIKSSIMLLCSSRKMSELTHFIQRKRLHSMKELISELITLGKSINNYINSHNTRRDMLSVILRKLIYTSSTITYHYNPLNVDGPHLCNQEYNTLCDEIGENMSWYKFNALLENAQFEFRGFNIIIDDPSERKELDDFKNALLSRYFGEDTCFNMYTQVGNFYIDIYFSNNEISFDLYRYCDLEWEYLGEHITEEQIQGTGLKRKNNSLILNINDDDDVDVSETIVKLIEMIFPENDILNGGYQSQINLWSSKTEECWILRETLNHQFAIKDYENEMQRIVNKFTSDFGQ